MTIIKFSEFNLIGFMLFYVFVHKTCPDATFFITNCTRSFQILGDMRGIRQCLCVVCYVRVYNEEIIRSCGSNNNFRHR